jgi:hypothetical protein
MPKDQGLGADSILSLASLTERLLGREVGV